MKNENYETCKAIAKEVEKYVDGQHYRCPNCLEVFNLYEEGGYISAEESDDGHERAACPNCGHESIDTNNFDLISLYDYFEDMLDMDWILDCQLNYKACRIMVACGGPNIYIDTYSEQVELFWWTERAEYPLSHDVCNAIDEWAEEYFNCVKGV